MQVGKQAGKGKRNSEHVGKTGRHASSKGDRHRKGKDDKNNRGRQRETPRREERGKGTEKTVLGVESNTLPPFVGSVHTPAPCARPRKAGRSPRPYPLVPRRVCGTAASGWGSGCVLLAADSVLWILINSKLDAFSMFLVAGHEERIL